jgi:hypothetical protein
MPATEGTSKLCWAAAAERASVRRLVLVSIGIVLAIGAFLFLRRLSGAFSAPLPTAPLVISATILSAWAIAIQVLASRWLGSVEATIAPIAIVLLFAVACSFPGYRLVDWLVWTAAVLVIVGFTGGSRSARWQRRRTLREPGPLGLPANEEPPCESHKERTIQRITRTRTGGRDTIQAELVAEFSRGARQASLFVAFCPPFERMPEVEASVADDTDATVKLAQVLHNGAQLEVRLPEPAEDAFNVCVEFVATALIQSADGHHLDV